jgi:hypothetical protein
MDMKTHDFMIQLLQIFTKIEKNLIDIKKILEQIESKKRKTW